MASIRKVNENTYEVGAYAGRDSEDKILKKYKRFTKPEGMTPKKWEKEIQIIAADFEKEVSSIKYIESDILFKDFVKRWIEEYAEKNLEATTLDFYKRELDNKILKNLGKVKLNQLTPIHILSYLNTLLKDGARVDGKPGPYSDRTIKNNWVIISSILQQAVYWQVIDDNPCKRIKPPKNKKSTKGYSTDTINFYDEEQALILLSIVNNAVTKYKQFEAGEIKSKGFAYSNPMKYQVAVNIALFCGLRNGEILGLTWDDIDFKEKTMTINKVRAFIESEGMITKSPKTKSSIRTISVPDVVIELLKVYKKEQAIEISKLGNLWDEEWYSTPWLFTQEDGKGMFLQTISKWLKKTVADYNKSIMDDENLKDDEKIKLLLPVLSIHKLRHTSATLLISKNTDIRTVSARLGHAQTSTTMDIYVHGLKSADRTASSALEDLLVKDKKKRKNKFKVVK